MIDRKLLTRQVLNNCNISDSQNAGLFSICGLALRLRDLYKWEKRLNPWEEKDSAEVLEWIGHKEEAWDYVTENAFSELTIDGQTFDPFDTSGINTVLAPLKLFYSAGYGRSLKPTFFLGVIDEKRDLNGATLYVTGHELARDLLTIPASSRGDRILLRKEAGRLYLWDQMQYVNKSGRPALAYALDRCGIKDHRTKNLQRQLHTIYYHQKEVYIYHELGEIKDKTFPRGKWRKIISEFPHTTVELAARTVKDLLADTCESGTLRRIVETQSCARLGFYVAFMAGLAKTLFPEIKAAFTDFIHSENWEIIEEATMTGYRNAKKDADLLISLCTEGARKPDRQWTEAAVEKQILNRTE